MTNSLKIVGGGDFEPNLEELGLKPFNYDILVDEQQIAKPQFFMPRWITPGKGASKALSDAVRIWLEAVQDDNEKRRAFTKTFVEEANKQYPNYNVVIIHEHHTTWGTWIKQHEELPMNHGTCGFEIYFSERGNAFSLANHGRGGYENWAYYGWFKRQNSHTIDAIVE